jgi:hypothetical protein
MHRITPASAPLRFYIGWAELASLFPHAFLDIAVTALVLLILADLDLRAAVLAQRTQ